MNGQINSEVKGESRRAPWTKMLKMLGIGFMSSIPTGIIFGLLLRLVMGIIAFFFPHLASGFSFGGTFILIVLGIAVTLANSILYTFSFKKSPHNWVRRGWKFGLFTLIIYGIPLFLSNPNNELFGPQAPLGISLFSSLFFLGPFLLGYFIDRIGRWVERSNRRSKLTYLAFALLIVPAIVMLVNLFAEIFYEMLPKVIENLSQFF